MCAVQTVIRGQIRTKSATQRPWKHCLINSFPKHHWPWKYFYNSWPNIWALCPARLTHNINHHMVPFSITSLYLPSAKLDWSWGPNLPCWLTPLWAACGWLVLPVGWELSWTPGWRRWTWFLSLWASSSMMTGLENTTILSSTSLILSSASVILLLVPSRQLLISVIALFFESFLFFLGPC